MRVWLPQILTERLDWMSKRENVSRPDVVRALMFEHLYGRPAYLALLDDVARRRAEETLVLARLTIKGGAGVETSAGRATEELGDVLFSRERSSRIDAEFIGKPTENFLLELPQLLKDDLDAIARIHGLSRSTYARKILVQQLCGEQLHARWQVAVGTVSKDVETWERDDDWFNSRIAARPFDSDK